MKIALLRVGVDAGCGGIQGPIFANDEFEFIPIPDDRRLNTQTYGNTKGRTGCPLSDFFPRSRQSKMANQPIHDDPEFLTFTYGDPNTNKRGLRKLDEGDLLVFYAGLQGFDCPTLAALYLIGYFDVQAAGLATAFTAAQIAAHFSQNFHVRYSSLFQQQFKELVLVKGGPASRLFRKAYLFSQTIQVNGNPLKVISPAMRDVFGLFGHRYSFQRSPTRWVDPAFVVSAAEFVRSLE
jgi:hypothetical protein